MVRATLLCGAYKKSFVKEHSEEITSYRKIHEKRKIFTSELLLRMFCMIMKNHLNRLTFLIYEKHIYSIKNEWLFFNKLLIFLTYHF